MNKTIKNKKSARKKPNPPKMVVKRREKTKKALLANLEKASGITAYACKETGISRKQFYVWYHDDPKFAEQVDDVKEAQKDFCEALILKKMKEGDNTILIFYAKTQMKDRGYNERREIVGKDGADLVPTPQYDLSKLDLTDEQRKALLSIGEQVLNETNN